MYLRQSTASQTRTVGMFVDDTDFKTAETALTIANTDVKLSANGGTSANKNSGGGTHRANGMYALTFDATDTATVGELAFSIIVSGALPVFGKFTVVEEAVYDALFAASAPGYVANAPVNVTQFGGSNGTFASGRPEVNTTHEGGVTVVTRIAGVAQGGGSNYIDLANGTTLAQVPQGSLIRVKTNTGAFQHMKVASITNLGGGNLRAIGPTGWTWPVTNPGVSSGYDIGPDDGLIPVLSTSLAQATQLPDTLGPNGNVKVDVRDVLGTAQIGTGLPGDNYRPTGASPS